jgi:hypothetical protein
MSFLKEAISADTRTFLSSSKTEECALNIGRVQKVVSNPFWLAAEAGKSGFVTRKFGSPLDDFEHSGMHQIRALVGL